jgi:hypothetical protein
MTKERKSISINVNLIRSRFEHSVQSCYHQIKNPNITCWEVKKKEPRKAKYKNDWNRFLRILILPLLFFLLLLCRFYARMLLRSAKKWPQTWWLLSKERRPGGNVTNVYFNIPSSGLTLTATKLWSSHVIFWSLFFKNRPWSSPWSSHAHIWFLGLE